MRFPQSRGQEMGSAVCHCLFQGLQRLYLLSPRLNSTPDNPYKAAKMSEHLWDQPIPKDPCLTPALCRQTRYPCFPSHSAHMALLRA